MVLASNLLVFLLALQVPAAASPSQDRKVLEANEYPRWFTEGKLGIWAHWGPQSVPMEGDWYARNMYIQGTGQYADHLKRYGHPSQHGYKDIIPLWKAEKWDPDALMAMYKAAGAKYFVSMGCHHDNFDLWNSKFHRWNAVNMGPHKDVVGTWQKAAKKLGLHFGVSEHMGASFTWFQVSRGSDKDGLKAGVPYDGNDPAYEDLYHAKTFAGDTDWYTKNPVFQHEWAQRITDLIDNYHPDLLYSDGGIPFGEVGEQVVAHYYTQSRERNHGRQEVVYNCKQTSMGRWAQDVERGVMAKIQPYPWQTDTSIGDWFYNKHWKYRGADWVLHTLIDVVSKNGNLLINVVQRPDGSLDPEAKQVLVDMADWMNVNHESIYGTTPWLTYGEGPTRAKGGAFSEDFPFSAQDVRYVAKGESTVYATMMGAPTPGEIVLRMLPQSSGAMAHIQSVSILGHGKTAWSWQADGLHVTIPDGQYSSIANVVKIKGDHLRSFQLPEQVQHVIRVGAGGVALRAGDAELTEGGIATETRNGEENLGFWDRADDHATWSLVADATGDYQIAVEAATAQPATELKLDWGSASSTVQIESTGSWDAFRLFKGGIVHLQKGEKVHLQALPSNPSTWHAINLRSVRLTAATAEKAL